MLINCDPSHSVFLLLTISLKQLLRSALQNFVKVKRKDLWWSSSSKGTCCNISRKDFIKGLSCEICEIFQNNSFQNNFRRMFLFRELALRRSIKTKSIWFGSLNKETPLTSNQRYLVKQLFQKKSKYSAVTCPWWSTVLIKSKVKFAEAGFHIFLQHFQFRQSILFVLHIQMSSSDL